MEIPRKLLRNLYAFMDICCMICMVMWWNKWTVVSCLVHLKSLIVECLRTKVCFWNQQLRYCNGI